MDLKGKQLSLMSKIAAVVIVLSGLVIKTFTKFSVDMDDFLKVAGFVAAAFSPVDVSMWIKNVKAKQDKTGDEITNAGDGGGTDA